MKYYKVLQGNGAPRVQGGPKWSLPGWYPLKNRRGCKMFCVGLWHTVVGPLVPCANGLHLVTPFYVKTWWAPKCRVFEVEVPKGTERIRHGRWAQRKIVVRTARLVREVQKGSPEWIKFGGRFAEVQ